MTGHVTVVANGNVDLKCSIKRWVYLDLFDRLSLIIKQNTTKH